MTAAMIDVPLRTFVKSSPALWQWAGNTEDECDKRGLVKGDREVVVAILGEGWEEVTERPPVVKVRESALWALTVASVDDLRRRGAGWKPDPDDVVPGLAVVNPADDEQKGEINQQRPGGRDEIEPVGSSNDVEQAGGISIGLFDPLAEQGGDERGRFGHVKRFLRRLLRRRDSSSKRVGI